LRSTAPPECRQLRQSSAMQHIGALGPPGRCQRRFTIASSETHAQANADARAKFIRKPLQPETKLGHLCCLQSHMHVLAKAHTQGATQLIILEDDVLFETASRWGKVLQHRVGGVSRLLNDLAWCAETHEALRVVAGTGSIHIAYIAVAGALTQALALAWRATSPSTSDQPRAPFQVLDHPVSREQMASAPPWEHLLLQVLQIPQIYRSRPQLDSRSGGSEKSRSSLYFIRK
jgi:hypothetical protein